MKLLNLQFASFELNETLMLYLNVRGAQLGLEPVKRQVRPEKLSSLLAERAMNATIDGYSVTFHEEGATPAAEVVPHLLDLAESLYPAAIKMQHRLVATLNHRREGINLSIAQAGICFYLMAQPINLLMEDLSDDPH